MTKEGLDKSVKNAANARVNLKIQKFKVALAKALNDLHPNLADPDGSYITDRGRDILRSRLNADGFPGFLWKEEEESVMNEILSTMNSLQKVLLAPEPKPEDEMPAPEKKS